MDPSNTSIASLESTTTLSVKERAGFYEVQDKDMGTASSEMVKEWYTFRCIPSRYAMLVLVAFMLLLSIVYLSVGAAMYHRLTTHVTDFQKIAMAMHIFVYAVLAFFCGFGIYAVVFRCQTQSNVFCAMLMGQILFGIASGAVCAYILFNEGKENTKNELIDCLNSIQHTPEGNFIKELCYRTPFAKGVSLALFLFMWILQILTWYASNRYSCQLQEETAADHIAQNKDVEYLGEAHRYK